MLASFASPGRYVQGRAATAQLGEEMERAGLAGPVLVIAGATARTRLSGDWERSLAPLGYRVEAFGGECSAVEIERLIGAARQTGARSVVGAGGGKLMDAARAVAGELGLGLAQCPTVASSDAPTSATSVVYTPEGVFDSYRFYRRNPDLVLVDTSVIAAAPPRYLVAGMGDALATWFEARACAESRSPNQRNGLSTQAALAIAKLCFDTLLADGAAALRAVEAGAVTPAVERIVETNTLLSGLGFESSGLAAAHSIHNGLTQAPAARAYLHGEKVAFGTLAQLVLEGRPTEEIDAVVAFSRSVGLPVTLAAVGLAELDAALLARIAERACAQGETIHHEPFEVTPGMVADALRAADALGCAATA